MALRNEGLIMRGFITFTHMPTHARTREEEEEAGGGGRGGGGGEGGEEEEPLKTKESLCGE